MKRPAKTNLGGLWLMNPHAPRCTQTNMEGIRDRFRFDPSGTTHTGRSTVMPTAWLLEIPSSKVILSDSGIVASGTGWEAFTGRHILRQQPYKLTRNPENLNQGGVGHPWWFGGGSFFPGSPTRPLAHCVWYDSLLYRQRDYPLPGGLLSDTFTFRGHYWSLYYGVEPRLIGGTIPTRRRWWLVAALEPDNQPLNSNNTNFSFASAWVFSYPEADPGIQSSSPSDAGSKPHQTRFNPLGANVFRRWNGNGSLLTDALTIKPYYG